MVNFDHVLVGWEVGVWLHGLKSVQTRSFFWFVFSRIRTEYGPEKTPYLDTFHAVLVSEPLSILIF